MKTIFGGAGRRLAQRFFLRFANKRVRRTARVIYRIGDKLWQANFAFLSDLGTFTRAPILSDRSLFAVDLCALGLSGKIGIMFRELLAGPGAVRATLKKYVN